MREKWDGNLNIHMDKHYNLKLFLSHARKRGSIYAAASVFAIAAALGTASFGPPLARAAADTQAALQQKLPSFAPLVKKVEGAVVSIRVKADAGAKLGLNEEGQLEN